VVQDVLKRGGGLDAMFDLFGALKESTGLLKFVADTGKALSQRAQQALRDRIALNNYLGKTDQVLTGTLMTGLEEVIRSTGRPIALLVDTYERIEGVDRIDDSLCRALVPSLPNGAKLVVFGRNALSRVNFDWGDYGDELFEHSLPELGESDAKRYLSHYGLNDARAQESVYEFTGGYPLLLFLVVYVARQAGGWNKVGTFESGASRDHVASKLLERILREERVVKVRDFLEKGVITPWFTAELVSEILDVGPEHGRAVFEKLKRHSFVEYHRKGLCFQEKIRQLLLERLKFSDAATYSRLNEKVEQFLERKSQIGTQFAGGSGTTPA